MKVSIREKVYMSKNVRIGLVILLIAVLIGFAIIWNTKPKKEISPLVPVEQVSLNNTSDKVFLLRGSKSAGQFSGVGIGFAFPQNSGALVQSVYPHSPAEKAGVQVGDLMKKIGGTTINESVGLIGVENLLRGPTDSYVNISVVRNGAAIDFQVKREVVCCDTRYVDNNDIFNSTDFVTWKPFVTNAPMPINPLYGRIFFTNGKVTLVDVNGSTINSAVSTDLVNWSTGTKNLEVPVSSLGSDNREGSNSTFSFAASINKIFAFIDSQNVTYESVPTFEMDGGVIQSLTSTKSMLETTDGLTWTEVAVPSWWKNCDNCSSSVENSFLLKGKLFVVTADAATVTDINTQKFTRSLHSSRDGVTWETSKLDFPQNTIIVPFGDKIIAYSYEQAKGTDTEVRFSADGVTWTKQANIKLMDNYNYLFPAHFHELNGELYIDYTKYDEAQSCGEGGCVYKTKDGIIWEKVDTSNSILAKIAGGLYVVLPELFGTKK